MMELIDSEGNNNDRLPFAFGLVALVVNDCGCDETTASDWMFGLY